MVKINRYNLNKWKLFEVPSKSQAEKKGCRVQEFKKDCARE